MNGSTSTKLTPIATDDQFASIVSSLPSASLLVLYFHAPWAAPCAQMSTVLETLASTYPQSDPRTISFLSIDAEELPDISEDHDVTAVPYVILQRGGTTLETISGSDAAKVRVAVEKHYNASSEKPESTKLPPAQQVTQHQQPLIPQPANGTATDAIIPKANASSTSATKNLSAYAPGKSHDDSGAQGGTTLNGGDTEPQDMHARLSQLVKAAPVMLFMKGTPSAPQCGFSRQLVSMLRENSVRYGFFNILADEEVRQGLKEFADWPTFPQLWLGGELVGGLDIVREEMENDPEFFNQYAVDTTKINANAGAPAASAAVAA